MGCISGVEAVKRSVVGVGVMVAALFGCDGVGLGGLDYGQCDADCHFERAQLALDNPDPAVLAAAIAAAGEPIEQDLLRVRLAAIRPALGPKLCAEVTTPAAREKCQQVVGRPHLQGVPSP